MQKFLSRVALLLTAVVMSAAFTSCSDDDNVITPNLDPPTFSMEINQLQRTQADFTVRSAEAADYAYIVVEDGAAEAPTAEEIFEQGTIGQLKDGVAEVKTLDVEGGKTYSMYVAVRRINPYVYSEVSKFDLNTDIAYADIVTLDRIGKTDFRYHVEFPEGATSMKHTVVKKTDYEAIKRILALFGDVTFETYLKVFGRTITESSDFSIDKYDAWGPGNDDDIHVHTNTPFYVMAGVPDASGNIDPEKFQVVEFTTRPAGVCPFDVNVAIETTSTTAKISLTPEPGITDYRVMVDKRSEFDSWRLEGEAQMRSVIIGHWDDSTNPIQHAYEGDIVLDQTGLIPETDYVVGIVGFDSERRECVKYVDFRTGEPVGPRPEITIQAKAEDVTAPWKSAAYNVKLQHAVSAVYGYFLKSQVDNVLASGSTMSAIIKNNGVYANAEDLAGMLSAEGATFETSELSANTEYVFGVYAVNDEYVASSSYVVFTTDKMPQLGGETRANMPGHYTASTTDADGNTVTFPVTITTGVNDATTEEYSVANRLVALGFGPEDQFAYKSPADLIAAGTSVDDANKLYGPKWFIEFREEGIVVPKPDNLSWIMYNSNGSNCYFWGIGVRPSTGRDIDNLYDFPVEVSADGNTVTVKGYYNQNIPAYYYPSMCAASSAWWYNEVLFRSYSDIVLTRDSSNSAYFHRGAIKAPRIVVIRHADNSEKLRRSNIANRINK